MGEPPGADSDRRPAVSFGPDRRLSLLALAVGLIFAGLAWVTGDPAGRILYALAALAGLGAGAAGLILTPWLVVSASGLQVRHGGAVRRIGWSDVVSADISETTRRGLSSRLLEIDDGDSLILLGRHVLGGDPADAAAVIEAFRR